MRGQMGCRKTQKGEMLKGMKKEIKKVLARRRDERIN